jgi:parallel beta-helix repeat protein
MDAPKTATVSWTTQFRLTSAANPPAGGSVSPSGENWYNAGSTATLTATPNGEYIFYWSGDLSGTTNPQDLTISGPKSVTANFVLIPVADFSASPRSTIAPPLDVQFTDESAGNITSWEWDFKNDGTVDSTLQTPDPCTYASAGRYTVKLTVRGPGGEDSETKTEYIRVCEDANAIYVKTNGNDTLDGRTLANAVKTLQKAIDRAIENGGTDWSVRVSAGTYNIAGDWNVDFKGYAIHMACPSGTWTIDGLNAAGNRGFVFQTDEGAHSVVDNCTIQRCIAPAGDDGGAVYCTGASPTIINCRIGSATYGNKGDNAGGIYCYGGSNLTITNCTVQRNAATAGNGGGIYCDTSSPRISGCTIGGAGVQNTATGNNGGGIYCYHSNPRITDCTIEANEADVGAGIYCDGSSPLIATCTIKDNLASGTAGTGGGIYLVTSSNATITNCTIYGNSAGYYGGGIYSETSTPTISGCGIGADGANSAGDTGGGICLYSSSPVITNCTIKNNTAVKMGGGIECWNYSDAAITNCLIASNSTTAATSGDGNGGGVDIYDASPTLSNCTIADNTATNNGGGMNAFISAPVLNNTIVWGNIADSDASTAGLGNQIYADKSDLKACTVTLNYSDYANGTGDIEGTGTVTANNCINSDPLFVGGGDYHLDSITPSPCIDAGSNALVLSGVTTDIEGLPRIAGTVVDMGAYEYQP